MDDLIFVTNHAPGLVITMAGESRAEAKQRIETWASKFTQGRPQATDYYTVEQLEERGCVGLYKTKRSINVCEAIQCPFAKPPSANSRPGWSQCRNIYYSTAISCPLLYLAPGERRPELEQSTPYALHGYEGEVDLVELKRINDERIAASENDQNQLKFDKECGLI